jgi:hypothetical protein
MTKFLTIAASAAALIVGASTANAETCMVKEQIPVPCAGNYGYAPAPAYGGRAYRAPVYGAPVYRAPVYGGPAYSNYYADDYYGGYGGDYYGYDDSYYGGYPGGYYGYGGPSISFGFGGFGFGGGHHGGHHYWHHRH